MQIQFSSNPCIAYLKILRWWGPSCPSGLSSLPLNTRESSLSTCRFLSEQGTHRALAFSLFTLKSPLPHFVGGSSTVWIPHTFNCFSSSIENTQQVFAEWINHFHDSVYESFYLQVTVQRISIIISYTCYYSHFTDEETGLDKQVTQIARGAKRQGLLPSPLQYYVPYASVQCTMVPHGGRPRSPQTGTKSGWQYFLVWDTIIQKHLDTLKAIYDSRLQWCFLLTMVRNSRVIWHYGYICSILKIQYFLLIHTF